MRTESTYIMAAYFDSPHPKQLLAAFDAAIALGNGLGGISTWIKVNGYYTHTSPQWGSKAFFQASTTTGTLTFNIVKPNGKSVSVPSYGFYHGHIIETMLNHFDKEFSTGCATALPAPNDKVQ